MNDSLNENCPIFIVGLPRSGTTLMGSLLSAHPAIAIAPETHFLNHWLKLFAHLDLKQRRDFELFWAEFSSSERFSYFGLEAGSIKAQILSKSTTDAPVIFSTMLQHYARDRHKQRWGEKTPAHYQFMDRLLEWYPQARLIYMLRDPRAVTRSLLDVPWASNYAVAHANRWRLGVRDLKRWLKEPRVLIVKYETLVTAPEIELRRVCEFVGEAFTPQMFDRSEESSPIINREGWARDHLQAALKPISTDNIEKWRTDLAPDHIAAIEYIARPEMRLFGHEPTTTGPTPRQFFALWRDLAWHTTERLNRRFAPALSRPGLKAAIKGSTSLYKRYRAGREAVLSTTRAGRVLFGSRHARSFQSWQDYLKPQPVVGYIGWLGYANLGDEAMYAAFRQMFPQFQFIITNDALPLELILHRHLIKRRRLYDVVFLGGGTLINGRRYLEALKQEQVRHSELIVFGTGVRDPSFWQQHYPPEYAGDMAEWVAVLERAAFVGVRGPQSAGILAAHGLAQVQVIGDPALSLCTPRPAVAPQSQTVAINLGCSGPMWGRQETLIDVIGRLSRHLIESGWQVEFLPMHGSDLQLGRELMDRFDLPRLSLWSEFQAIDKTLDRIRSYDLVIGQRLHAAVLACGLGVPAISLAYRPKCEDFMASIGRSNFALRTDRAGVDSILALMDEIMANYAEQCQQTTAACDQLRQLQRQAATQVLGRLSVGAGARSASGQGWDTTNFEPEQA
jgi:hypothetical protein